VTLTVTDPTSGDVAQSTIIIEITENNDSDGDGVMDSEDLCPNVRGSVDNHGCPIVSTPDYFCVTLQAYTERVDCPDQDSDGDGIIDRDDACPFVAGPASNQGCPTDTGSGTDSDGDGIIDRDDACPQVR